MAFTVAACVFAVQTRWGSPSDGAKIMRFSRAKGPWAETLGECEEQRPNTHKLEEGEFSSPFPFIKSSVPRVMSTPALSKNVKKQGPTPLPNSGST
jgi:hypothetical protein